MNFYSTNNKQHIVDFKTATIQGQAPDRGLYFPEQIPILSKNIINNIEQMSNEDIAFEVIKPYVGNTIPEDILQQIVNETIQFSIPLHPITATIGSLELYHGPTLAFKDIGARFMSRCLSYFLQNKQQKVTVLVATSGDTGGAVANGFYDVPNIEVVILYPSGKVSSVQENQLTSLGKNIQALEVNGSFDDCQQMVKTAFLDKEVNDHLFLTSANSINLARWLPQQFYYFFGYKQWQDKSSSPIVAVPSGNFGNICAGLLAKKSGLPIQHFIAACNANDTVPQFLQTGNYVVNKAIPTLSNAMDVADPSNFVRILELFANEISSLKEDLTAYSISDHQTTKTIKTVLQEEGYLLDPHGAVAYHALNEYLRNRDTQKGFIIETAHPVKFYDVIEPLIGTKVIIPESIQAQMKQEKKSIVINNDFEELKSYLLKK